MEEVSVRELRNCSGRILARVEGGESMTITRDGTPVARLSPLPTPRLSASALVDLWKDIPVIGADALREDIGDVLDLNRAGNDIDYRVLGAGRSVFS